MKLSYAKYAHNQSDTPDSVRRYQMDKDFRDIDNRYKFNGNKDDKYSNDYADENINVLDNKGEWGMGALDKNKVNRRLLEISPTIHLKDIIMQQKEQCLSIEKSKKPKENKFIVNYNKNHYLEI